MATPPPPIYWLPAWLVSAGRNEGKWFPRKQCSAPGEPDLRELPARLRDSALG